jgi:type II secretory ATPase GspE/PulE/Tfp pilus assembly ATPase PilB-like protein
MSLIGKEIGELLVDNGLISDTQLQLVLEEKKKTGQSISQILARLGLVTENQLKDTLELQYGATYVALNKIKIEPRTINLLSEELIRTHRVLPISQQEDHLNLAMVNPDDAEALKQIQTHLQSFHIKAMVCLADDFERFVNFFFPSGQPAVPLAPAEAVKHEASAPPPPQASAKEIDLQEEETDASDLGNFLLRQGVLDIDQLYDALRSSLQTNKSLTQTLVDKKVLSKEKIGELIKLMNSSSGNQAKLESPAEAGGRADSQTTDKVRPSGQDLVNELRNEEENGSGFQDSEDDIDFLNLFKQAPQTPVSLLAHQIITKAVERQWSDIHIEGRKDFILVKYVNKLEVMEESRLDKEFFPELVASYKLFAGLDASQVKKPQDNRIPMTILNRQIELRVTTIPEEHQEMVAISIKYLKA